MGKGNIEKAYKELSKAFDKGHEKLFNPHNENSVSKTKPIKSGNTSGGNNSLQSLKQEIGDLKGILGQMQKEISDSREDKEGFISTSNNSKDTADKFRSKAEVEDSNAQDEELIGSRKRFEGENKFRESLYLRYRFSHYSSGLNNEGDSDKSNSNVHNNKNFKKSNPEVKTTNHETGEEKQNNNTSLVRDEKNNNIDTEIVSKGKDFPLSNAFLLSRTLAKEGFALLQEAEKHDVFSKESRNDADGFRQDEANSLAQYFQDLQFALKSDENIENLHSEIGEIQTRLNEVEQAYEEEENDQAEFSQAESPALGASKPHDFNDEANILLSSANNEFASLNGSYNPGRETVSVGNLKTIMGKLESMPQVASVNRALSVVRNQLTTVTRLHGSTVAQQHSSTITLPFSV